MPAALDLAASIDARSPGAPSPLVSAAWLAERLGAPGLVVVDATVLGVQTAAGPGWLSGHDRYLVEGHIPGAVFADLIEEFSEPDSPFAFTRPGAERFRRAATALGIDDDSTVIVYDSALGQWAARLWWLLRAFGVTRSAVLDGGLGRWTAEGRPVELGHRPAHAGGQLTISERPELWADKAEVASIVAGETDATLLCAIPARDYAGAPGDRPRAGHIPGSVNVPLAQLLDRDRGGLLAGAPLAGALAPATAPGARVVAYCAGGIAAAASALALTAAGHPAIAVYDGSLNEWAADPHAPLVTTPDPAGSAG